MKKRILLLLTLHCMALAMEAPVGLLDLEPTCIDPVMVFGHEPGLRWKLSRTTLFEAQTIANQALLSQVSSHFLLPGHFTGPEIHEFLTSLAAFRHATSPTEFKQTLALKNTAQLAQLIEMAEVLNAPNILEPVLEAFAYRCIASPAECLATGKSPYVFNDEVAPLVAEATLAKDPSTAWFWLLKHQEINHCPPVAIPTQSADIIRHFFLQEKHHLIDSRGYVWNTTTKKIVKQVPPPLANGLASDHLLCNMQDPESGRQQLVIMDKHLQAAQGVSTVLSKAPRAAAISRSGEAVAVADDTPCVQVIDVASQRTTQLQTGTRCCWLDFSPDGKLLAVVLPLLRKVALWNLQEGKCVMMFGQKDEDGLHIHYAAFSPCGTKILAVDTQAYIADIAAASWQITLKKIWSDVLAARYNHTGDLVATTHEDAIYIWDAHTGNMLRQFKNLCARSVRGKSLVTPAIFSEDSHYLATCQHSDQTSFVIHRLFDPAMRKLLAAQLSPEHVALLHALRDNVEKGRGPLSTADHHGITPILRSMPEPLKQLMLPFIR